jgi:2-polyprenyl-3-methyl-5-hydroxy-6-metoxy-1,4-benzoquinol methylase
MSIRSVLGRALDRLGARYARRVCAREYRRQSDTGTNERPLEYAFLFRELAAFWPKTVLDVGTGMTALPHLLRTCGFLVTATDNVRDYWPGGMVNRHYHVIDDDITDTKLHGTFDVVTCISVLEHIPAHGRAMQSMQRLLRPGGRLVLTCPYNEARYVPNVYQLPESSVRTAYPFATQAFSRKEVEGWMAQAPWELLAQEYWQFFEGEYWTCGARLPKPTQVSRDARHQLSFMVFAKPSPAQPPGGLA